jgi:oxygen-independent coproporphyrinogen-3 oxidase
MWGTDIRFVQQEFGEDFGDFLVRAATPHLENGRMTRKNDTFYLSDQGKLFADGITADLFMDRNPG